MTFDELKSKIDRINALAADPHPGLMTWSVMFGDAIESLIWAWLGEKTPSPRVRALVARIVAGGEEAVELIARILRDEGADCDATIRDSAAGSPMARELLDNARRERDILRALAGEE